MGIAESLRVERAPAPIRSRVLDNLRQAILEHKLVPGQRLIERELVELTGVSRTSIREALRELAAEGLVTTIPNKGTVVAEVSVKEARQLYQLEVNTLADIQFSAECFKASARRTAAHHHQLHGFPALHFGE